MHFLMQLKKTISLINSSLFVLTFSLFSNVAFSDSYLYLSAPPSNELTKVISTTTLAFNCYEESSGDELECLIDYELNGLENDRIIPECIIDDLGAISTFTCSNGGHTHDNPKRPIIFDNGNIIFLGDKKALHQYEVVRGSTLTGETDNPNVIHNLSQAGGVYSWTADVHAPGGWHFSNGGSIKNYVGLTDVHTPNLVQLKDPVENNYNKVRSGPQRGKDPDPYHLDNVSYAAAKLTRTVLPKIAYLYKNISGRTLSINDISLPRGGVFEAKSFDTPTNFNWKYDHREHREGLDVDINRPLLSWTERIFCTDGVEIMLVVDAHLKPPPSTNNRTKYQKNVSALLCESKGRYHIDFTEEF